MSIDTEEEEKEGKGIFYRGNKTFKEELSKVERIIEWIREVC